MTVKILKQVAMMLMLAGVSFQAMAKENLRIMGNAESDTSYTVTVNGKKMVITRQMTSCAKNKGWLQPLIPVKGVHPITEIEVLKSMNDSSFILLDMRAQDHFVEGTIPGAKNIPYTEVSMRLDELGCKKVSGKWNCPQSSIAIKASVREGFPADKFYYYRGGMLDWSALGFPIIEPDF